MNKKSFVEASKRDYKYLDRTKDGQKIVKVYQQYTGYLTVIAESAGFPGEYDIYRYYDPKTSTWSYGHYRYDSLRKAEEAVHDMEPKSTIFDPNDERDVEFEYDAKFNYNNVSAPYLRNHDHRSPDFDTYANVVRNGFDHLDKNGNVVINTVSRGDFRAYKSQYREREHQGRSLNKKPTGKRVMPDTIFAYHPVTKKAIKINVGETGYYEPPNAYDPPEKFNEYMNPGMVDAQMMEDAVAGSMFGWDIPLIKERYIIGNRNKKSVKKKASAPKKTIKKSPVKKKKVGRR